MLECTCSPPRCYLGPVQKKPAWTIPFFLNLMGPAQQQHVAEKRACTRSMAFQVLHSVAQSLRDARKFKTVGHPTNSHTPIRPRITLDVWCDTMAPIVELRSDRLVLDNGDVQAILSGQNPVELSLSSSSSRSTWRLKGHSQDDLVRKGSSHFIKSQSSDSAQKVLHVSFSRETNTFDCHLMGVTTSLVKDIGRCGLTATTQRHHRQEHQ